MTNTRKVFNYLLTACLLCSVQSLFIQHTNSYPSWINHTNEWLEYHTNNCSFIQLQYSALDLSNIPCLQSNIAIHLSTSHIIELYTDSSETIYNIIIFNKTDTINIDYFDPIDHQVAYNIFLPDIHVPDRSNESDIYANTPYDYLPKDCYITHFGIKDIDTTETISFCEITLTTDNTKYFILWNGINQDIFTCSDRGKYNILCFTNPSTSSLAYSGCFDESTAREIIENKIYACPGDFPDSFEDSENLCDIGYHVCDNWEDTKTLGLTYDICSNNVALTDDEFFAVHDSIRIVDEVQIMDCDYDTGYSYFKNLIPRVWELRLVGCALLNSSTFQLGKCHTLNAALTNGMNGHWNEWTLFGDYISNNTLNNASSGGVLCCIDNMDLVIHSGFDHCTHSYQFESVVASIIID
eukprot:317102_1